MKVELNARFASDEELITDLKQVAAGASAISHKFYNENGRFHSTSIVRRFGGWSAALARAGLRDGRPDLGLDEETWMTNIYDVWVAQGRQPTYEDMRGSLRSPSAYARRYGGWGNTLLAFQTWIDRRDGDDQDAAGSISEQGVAASRPSRREPNLRLRWRVIQRDRFTCVACGASPAITMGIRLQVDHVVPWAKGGRTEISNLQTLCETCNSGKSDLLPSTVASGS